MHALITNLDELKTAFGHPFAQLQPQSQTFIWRGFVRYFANTEMYQSPAPTSEQAQFASKRLPNQNIVKIDINDDLRHSIGEAIQFLAWAEKAGKDSNHKNHPNILQRLLKHDFAAFGLALTKWRKSLEAEIDSGDVFLVKQIGDFSFVLLKSEAAFKRHGQKLGNCIGREDFGLTDYYGEHLMGDIAVFAMTDRNNDHHASIVVNTPLGPPSIREIVGKENISAHPKYVSTLREFIETLYGQRIKLEPAAELSAGYLTVAGEKLDLLDGEQIPEYVSDGLTIHRSRWPVSLPEGFVFGSDEAFRQSVANRQTREYWRDFKWEVVFGGVVQGIMARQILKERGWLEEFERYQSDEIPVIRAITPPIAVLSDVWGIKLPKRIAFNGNVMADLMHAETWPDELDIKGSFGGSRSNITIWRKRYSVEGRSDLRKSLFRAFEDGTFLRNTIDFSHTPFSDFGNGFIATRNVIAQHTPNLHKIPNSNIFSGDLDLTASGLREIEPRFNEDGYIFYEDGHIGGTLTVSETKDFIVSPPGLVVLCDYIATNCNLEKIGDGTNIEFNLDLTGSRVTELPLNSYVGASIRGPDGKLWDVYGLSGTGFTNAIREFNANYKSWQPVKSGDPAQHNKAQSALRP